MGSSSRRTNVILLLPPLLILFFLNNHFSTAVNTTLTRSQYITDPQTIVSSAETFKLGFFSSGNSTNHYVGIWFNNIPEKTIVWVANRDTPLKDSSGVLRIADDGNLVVLDGQENLLWTSNVSNVPSNNSMVELLDSGNLVLREVTSNSNGKILWQSFDHPSNTMLRGMKFGVNLKTGIKQVITSWKDTKSDPSTGRFTLELDPVNVPQAIIVNNSNNQRYWRSGPWNERVFIGIPNMYNIYLNGFSLPRDNQEGTFYLTLAYTNDSALERWVLDSDGKFLQMIWDENIKQWVDSWYSRHSECDIYSKCGPYGSCNALDSPICSCLRGFEPKFKNEWSKGNWSGGCMRRTELQCERINRTNESNNETNANVGKRESDGFLKLEKMKVPDHVNWWNAEVVVEECEHMCLTNCSCIAYSFDSNIGCMWWRGDLIDIQKFSNFSQALVDLHIRVAYSELDKKKDKKKIIIITILTTGIVTISLCSYFCWWIAKQRGRNKKGKKISLFDTDDGYGETSDPNMLGDNPELKIVNFEMLALATDNFSGANKLGHGGFGSVYKGKFPDGQEIAVKRLSKSSGQGLKEFKNEVLVILKLQHRNLVRLLGCCIEGEEKMLIYEFMPNKSLDFFLFDPTKRALLDWRKRIQIIEGISRGILYLHRDSRLRVIHRDLKASNVLLDEELNPKISDFGMARIFGGNELEANTMRVVGTYGYMSPEYAMEGLFSEKSDVFSFGVLLLEIVSGERSTSFCRQGQSLSLLGYAWELWNENKMKLLIDPMLLAEPLSEEEILRCIHVGLLCVQDFAKDRPTMSTTLSMLTSEIATLPTPKQPAFTERQVTSGSTSFQNRQKPGSVNNVTITNIRGR